MTEHILVTDSLCRSFGQTQVLHDVSFATAQGSVCSLLGTNGAGKTTLLKLLMALIEPTRGSCAIAGDSGLPRRQSTLRSTGCLIDGFEPPGGTRVKHLLSLSHDVGPRFDRDRAMSLLAAKGIARHSVWKSLSKGQKRWTLLVLLLCRGCDVLLLDEPADGLDPAARRELYELIRREVNERGVTTLITTHIINDIEQITDDVCILHAGRILLQDNLEDLRDQVLVVELPEPTDLPPDIQVLRHEIVDHSTYWLRDPAGVLKEASLPGEIRRRKAGLEEIYLAVTKAATEPGARRLHQEHTCKAES